MNTVGTNHHEHCWQVLHYVEENARLCKPNTIHICDGSERENELITYMLQKDNMLRRLPKYENW